MKHSIEPAASGRATCRGCGRRIGKGELRLGEHLPNPYADRGVRTLWFHLRCAAYKRPELALAALLAREPEITDRDALLADARFGADHRRLPRLDGAQVAPTGRARCRSCREMIAKDTWRVALVYFEEGRFEPSGFIHVTCAQAYFDTTEILDRLAHFTPDLEQDAVEALRAALSE